MRPYVQSLSNSIPVWGQHSPYGRPGHAWTDAEKMFAHPPHEPECCNCGWPIKSSVLKAGRDDDGNRLFCHPLCPTSKERAELRRQAITHA